MIGVCLAPDCTAAPEMLAAWIVCGAMTDGIDLWASGADVLSYHGPLEAREKWHHTMQTFRPMIRAYLQLEVWPGGRR